MGRKIEKQGRSSGREVKGGGGTRQVLAAVGEKRKGRRKIRSQEELEW